MARLQHSLSTLRPLDCSQRTQDSLLVAGQALPDGICTRWVPTKGFCDASYINSPFPKLLGAGCVPFFPVVPFFPFCSLVVWEEKKSLTFICPDSSSALSALFSGQVAVEPLQHGRQHLFVVLLVVEAMSCA